MTAKDTPERSDTTWRCAPIGMPFLCRGLRRTPATATPYDQEPATAVTSARTILFDVDGVLIHSLFHPDPARRRRWDQHLLDDLGVAPEALAPLFGPRFVDVIEGRSSIVTELDAFLPTIGYRGSSLDFLAYWLTRDVNLNLRLLDLVRRLRAAGARLFIATNQEHVRAFHLWNEVGLRHYFDDMFYAARFGVSKHQPGFYQRVDALLGPQAEPPLFFDDSAKVVVAARTHGWDSVLYTDFPDCAEHAWISARLR